MFSRSVVFLAVTLIAVQNQAQQPDPDSPRVKTVEAFVELLEQADDDIGAAAKSVLAENDFDELKQKVEAIRSDVKQVEVSDIMLENETTGKLVYELANRVVTIEFGMTADPPIRINYVAVEVDKNNDAPPLTWENVEATFEQAAKDGFAGAVLITRNGETVLNKGYGFANREKQIKNTPQTVFAIGSAPIDFTHAGILLLKDQDKLKLDDPVTKYFADVPEDKRSITIRHLMTGRSGLLDFPGLPSDANQDHSWIDREEFVRRVFAQKLLFEPGKGRKHSHCAWGMLAAIIEIVSDETYQQFTTERLFKPAGMKDTGFFGDPVPDEKIAVGYGYQKSSEPNSPPNWGKTSWLVMGSGGQVSTLGDMLRWETAMRTGKTLSPESKKLYLRGGDGVSADGDMFGFEFMHSRNPDQLFMIISNAVDSREKRQKFDALGRRLNGLVRGSKAQYSLGIAMRVGSDEGVIVERVVAGSAAEKDGLQSGDVLVSANGLPMADEPMEVLGKFLKNGTPIEFEVIRDGKTQTIRVTPLPKK